MQRGIIAATGLTVCAEDLGLNIEKDDETEIEDVVDIGDYQPDGSFEQQIHKYKVKLALSAVIENDGNKTLSARKLGISRAYLHRLIRQAETAPVLEEPPAIRQLPERGAA